MAPYYTVYNLDKKQLIRPSRFNDGHRLKEFGASPCGTMLALAVLLAHGHEHGGIHSHHELIGTWAADRIAIIGDESNISCFEEDLASFTDISEHILQALCEDDRLRARLLDQRHIAPLDRKHSVWSTQPLVPSPKEQLTQRSFAAYRLSHVTP